MQLTGTAGAMQLPGARRGAVQNMGGVGIANYVSVLESV
jgi:acetyl-CoA C-acetyltransferase